MQKAILERNFFVETFIPRGVVRQLTPTEMEHYRAVQPSPEARRGVAEFPHQIRAARRWIAQVERGVQNELARKPLLLTWGMLDFAFPAGCIPRWREAFPDQRLVELPGAKHFFQEDAGQEVAHAIAERFG
jgi:haloalkane dehalogenase